MKNFGLFLIFAILFFVSSILLLLFIIYIYRIITSKYVHVHINKLILSFLSILEIWLENLYKTWNFGMGLSILKYLYSPIFDNSCDHSEFINISLLNIFSMF